MVAEGEIIEFIPKIAITSHQIGQHLNEKRGEGQEEKQERIVLKPATFAFHTL